MVYRTCSFFGHSNAPLTVYPALATAIERHITEYGVNEFLVGQYGNFDSMAKRAVAAAKERHPEIKLDVMVPYLPEPSRQAALDRDVDHIIYPEGLETVPRKFAISRLNQIMVRDSDYAIAYVTHTWGGAYNTMKAAQKLEREGKLTIQNLGLEACSRLSTN